MKKITDRRLSPSSLHAQPLVDAKVQCSPNNAASSEQKHKPPVDVRHNMNRDSHVSHCTPQPLVMTNGGVQGYSSLTPGVCFTHGQFSGNIVINNYNYISSNIPNGNQNGNKDNEHEN